MCLFYRFCVRLTRGRWGGSGAGKKNQGDFCEASCRQGPPMVYWEHTIESWGIAEEYEGIVHCALSCVGDPVPQQQSGRSTGLLRAVRRRAEKISAYY